MTDKDFLEHFGKLGMKWGKRKPQDLKVENRKATKSDAEKINKLLNGLSDKDKKFLALKQKQHLIKQNIKDGRHCLISIVKGEVVGFMRESGRPNGFVLMEELVVNPEYRNKGIASKILDDFHKENPKTLAKTKANNEGMKRLLEKNGYKPDNSNSKTIINWTRDTSEVKHGGDRMYDKTKSIKSATDMELDNLIIRLRKESEAQNIIRDIQRKSEPNTYPYGQEAQVSTEVPIETLYHFGKMGMKWGRRSARTPIQKTKPQLPKNDMSADAIRKNILKSKNINRLSNADIKALNERLQLEKQYGELNKKEISKGKAFASQVLGTSGKTVATAVATAAGMYFVKKAIGKTMGKDALGEMFPKK